MSDAELLAYLEGLGEVPNDPTQRDWAFAQKTTWWGKPLDPAAFWTNRAVWLDASATWEAQRHGRGYPPIPVQDPTLPAFATERDLYETNSAEIESPNVRYHFTAKESAFWDRFGASHPKPPELLERLQSTVSASILALRGNAAGSSGGVSSGPLAQVVAIDKSRALEQGCPPEALTEDALFWSSVLASRKKYADLSAGSGAAQVESAFRSVERYGFDPKLITQPLTDDQAQAADAWKAAYLRRLRTEKIDLSYINGYMKAWHLDSSRVFGVP